MAKLKITELKNTGAELFEDSETFLNELSSNELESVTGGRLIYPTVLTYPTVFTCTLTGKTTLPYTIVIL
ncbi:MAG: hypothetical protein KME21_08175 [Desmonostoc vinosum HA7617-LM4]|jgi:bacteriocin-like protein|nr:hypothetical protein [Desmonostoc vinosum HA7617-LM4]